MRVSVRRCLIFLTILLGVTLFMVGYVALGRSGPVTRANYNRIQIGMSQSNVEAIIGGPGAELAPLGWDDIHFVEDSPTILAAPWPHNVRSWATETHRIGVLFDGKGNVIGKYCQRHPDKTSRFERVIDWLGL
jgi:hypothetical protein